jgi:hypothetical protein
VRRSAFLVLAALLGTSPAAAQKIEKKETSPGQWLTSYYPFIATLPNNGPSFEFRAQHWQMAPYEAPVTAAVLFSGRAAWAPWGGSWLVNAGMEAPLLAKGWRFMADVRAGSDTRYGFYGLGNTDGIDPDATRDTEPYLYRVERNLYAATIDVTRKIVGPLSASIMLNGAIADYNSLSPTSLFELTYGPSLDQTEGSVTGALVLDLRNTEYDTRKGLLVEAGGQYGGSERNYSRWYGIARGWVPATKSTVLAARVFATNIGGTPTLLSQQVVPGWESPYAALGGEDSHRALPFGRFTGSGFLGTNLEVRQDVFAKGEYGALGVVLFMDAGRSFQNDFKVTFDDWTVGGGGGLVLRILRGNVFILTYGISKNESHVGFRTGWMF